MGKIFKTSQRDLVKYNGMKCNKITKLSENLYSEGHIYNIELENGIEIQAFENEIINIRA